MTETVDLSSPVAGSGQFIELHQIGALEKAQPAWNKYCRLRRRLEVINEQLCLCNEAVWLFPFADKCRRQGGDFEKQLRSHRDALEGARNVLEDAKKKIWSRLMEIAPCLSQASYTLAGVRLVQSYQVLRIASQALSDDILKRRSILAKYPHLNSSDLCRRFDIEGLPVPHGWTEKFRNVDSWVTAYRNTVCRNRIHKMVSEAKRKFLLR